MIKTKPTHNKTFDCRLFIIYKKSLAEEIVGRDIATITLSDLERDFIGSCKLWQDDAWRQWFQWLKDLRISINTFNFNRYITIFFSFLEFDISWSRGRSLQQQLLWQPKLWIQISVLQPVQRFLFRGSRRFPILPAIRPDPTNCFAFWVQQRPPAVLPAVVCI